MSGDIDQDRVRRRLLDTATALFAELGYDQMSTQMIADTAGMTVEEVTRQTGGKRELYVAVMRRAYEQEQAMLEQAAAEFTHDAAGVHRFLDRYLDFFVAHPQSAALWMQRRLHDAADIQLEAVYTVPQMTLVARLGDGVFAPDVDVELMLLTIVWSVHVFVQSGVPDAHGRWITASDDQMLSRFRAHQHRLVECLTGLPHPADRPPG